MGSWCETCGITKLPIKWEDPIVMIPLYGHGETDYVYSDTAYSPMWLPLFGKYSDYGDIEMVENRDSLEKLFTLVKEKLSGKARGTKLSLREDSHYKLDKPDDLSRIIERGYLTAKKPAPWVEEGYTQNYMVDQFMCHRSAYEALVKEIGSRKPYDKDKTFRELLEDRLNTQVEIHKKYLACDPEDRLLEFMDYNREGIFSYFNESGKADMSPALMWYLEEQPEGLKDQILDFICFKIAMSFGRMEWRPQIGKGSQSQEMAIQMIIANQILEKTEQSKKDYLDDNFLDEGEEYSFGETIFWRD